VLEDGTVYDGESIGPPGRALGEVVFDTAMVGYQQCLTDPSFRGQILTFTYPLIGNYGSNDEDFESAGCHAAGLVVREACDGPSNFRSEESLDSFLSRHGVVGIAGVDTRALTRRLRTAGVMMGCISTDETAAEALTRLRNSPKYDEVDLVRVVSTPRPYEWHPGVRAGKRQPSIDFEERLRLVVLDYGVRESILHNLHRLGCRCIVLPSSVTSEQVLEEKPDGVLLSPGPGDPVRLTAEVETVRGLVGRVPVFGVCLGNQMLATALGGKTFKLKFGHRGGNHPVKDLLTDRVKITSQNHGYAVDPESIEGRGARVSQLNLNDQTVEGLECEKLHAFSIQYHAEASPGPQDSRGLFKQFVQRMREPQRWSEIHPEVW
jgi:carbamoyl-phosphate synthase small subunit